MLLQRLLSQHISWGAMVRILRSDRRYHRLRNMDTSSDIAENAQSVQGLAEGAPKEAKVGVGPPVPDPPVGDPPGGGTFPSQPH